MTFSLLAAKKPPGWAMARVVDHQRHVWRQRGGGGHIGGVVHVQAKGLHTWVGGDAGGVARSGIDLARTAGKQLSHKCQANAEIGTGNGPWHGYDQAAVSLTAAIKALARAA